jgi:hypothetical protein
LLAGESSKENDDLRFFPWNAIDTGISTPVGQRDNIPPYGSVVLEDKTLPAAAF